MIIEIATAAAMYLAENVTAAQSDIPQMRPRAALCRDRDPQKIRQCFDRKQQQEPDPYAQMWDPNWVSSITAIPEVGVTNTSATTANPNVAKKPLK
jgi:hypothetical protein